jgi:ABC-type Fe3+-citrate transport system substrate-binding protein
MKLEQAQVEQMELKEVNKHLKQLSKDYKLDKPLKEWMTPELWDNLDDIINSLLYLEDRKQWLEQYGHLRGENKV